MTPLRRLTLLTSKFLLSLVAVAGLVVVLGAAAPTSAQAAEWGDIGYPTMNWEIFKYTSETTDASEEDPYTVAGGHPFQNNTLFGFPVTHADSVFRLAKENLKDAGVELPLGFFGNPAAATRCPVVLKETFDSCPDSSRVGWSAIKGGTGWNDPIFNVKPDYGYPAQFAFLPGEGIGSRVTLFATLRPRTEGYGITVGTLNATRVAPWYIDTIFCSYGSETRSGGIEFCKSPAGYNRAPFLTNPVDCADAEPSWDLALDSWEHPGRKLLNGVVDPINGRPDLTDPNWLTGSVPAHPVTGCEALVFAPSMAVKPLQGGGPIQADQPSGLAVDLDFPQNNDPTDMNATFDPDLPQTPSPKDITVKLPAGLSISAASASGLGACSDQASDPAGDQVHYDNTQPVKCPDSSKIGTAVATSPLLATHDPVTDDVNGAEPIPGDVYLLKPHPGDLPTGGGKQTGKFRLLIQLEHARYGTNFKLPGVAVADPNTGQITTTFTQNPQLPSKHVAVNLKTGPRAPLASPTSCGSFTSTSDLVPWGTPTVADAHPSSSFNVSSGPGGSPCPLSPAARPFAPTISAGMQSNAAGKYSPFVLRINRGDGEQELSTIDVTTPKGFSAKLAGVPYCSEAAIASAAKRSGLAEQSNPSCPGASQIGTVVAGAGPGASPYYATGHAYLAGPYKGAPLSFAFITPAVAGPFDLGTTVVRAAAFVDPETAQVTTKTDPLPQIIDGVPLKLRSIVAYFDRQNFTINPTNCSAMSVSAAIASSDGAAANPSNPFQVGGCDKLGFKPKLKIALKGGTKRGQFPALKATLDYPAGAYANIAKAQVTLPHSEFLEQSHIKTICTRVQFAASACPAASIYGKATAITPLLDAPLSGPVYLRSSSNKLPDLVADLGGQIHVALVGRIDSIKGGIRTTFDAVPDAPVSKFTLEMQGAKKGLLVNSTNICNSENRAIVNFDAQNGLSYDTKPLLSNSCKKSKKRKGAKGKAHKRSAAR